MARRARPEVEVHVVGVRPAEVVDAHGVRTAARKHVEPLDVAEVGDDVADVHDDARAAADRDYGEALVGRGRPSMCRKSVPAPPSTMSLPSPTDQLNVSRPPPRSATSSPVPPVMTSWPGRADDQILAGPRRTGTAASCPWSWRRRRSCRRRRLR